MATEKKKNGGPKKTSEGTPEVDRDIRVDEAWKANLKRTFDEYQNQALRVVERIDGQIANLHTIRTQILANMAVNCDLGTKQFLTNSDLITKQCIRHNDVAIDCTWDPGPGEESLQGEKVTSSKRKR
jgi:hypothetical protein